MIFQSRLADAWLRACSKLGGFDVAGFQTPLGPIIHTKVDLRTREGRSLLAHELAHGEQMKRLGLARFCFRYLTEWRRHGYRYMPLEEEARRAQASAAADEG